MLAMCWKLLWPGIERDKIVAKLFFRWDLRDWIVSNLMCWRGTTDSSRKAIIAN